MWQIFLILSQILALVISENVTNSANGPLLRVPLTKTTIQMEHFRNRRSTESDAAAKNLIIAFKEMTKPRQNQVVDAICRGNHLSRVNLQSHNNLFYTGSIYIGHPDAQQFTVIFDTGSSDIWVPSVESHVDNRVHQMQRKYNSSKSNSYKEGGKLFSASYGSGVVNGFTSIDQIKIGDLVIENQVFAEITNLADGIFPDSNIDGIFGLGFKTISKSSPHKTPLDHLKDQNFIRERIFCFNMNSEKDKFDIELIIGGCTFEAKFYLPVKKSGYWHFHMTSIDVIHYDKKSNRKQVLATGCNGGCDAILDTGSTEISGPRDEITKINNLLGAKYSKKHNHYSIQCGKTDLPDIVFHFGDNQITLAPKDYIIQVQPESCVSGFNVLSGFNGPIKYVIGDIILRRVVSIHDMEKERIGFEIREN